jgi:hypothetical protein
MKSANNISFVSGRLQVPPCFREVCNFPQNSDGKITQQQAIFNLQKNTSSCQK